MENKLVSLVAGPTDKTKISRFGIIRPDNYEAYLAEIAETLIKDIGRINIIPDEGVPLDLAKKFKELGGYVAGYIPKDNRDLTDRNFKHCTSIEEFDTGWSGLNTCLSLRGDIIVALGLSPGTMVEIAYTKYHRAYQKRNVPILIDSRTFGSKIPLEVSEEIDLRYFADKVELGIQLSNLRVRK